MRERKIKMTRGWEEECKRYDRIWIGKERKEEELEERERVG